MLIFSDAFAIHLFVGLGGPTSYGEGIALRKAKSERRRAKGEKKRQRMKGMTLSMRDCLRSCSVRICCSRVPSETKR